MFKKKKEYPQEKSGFHPRNKHRNRYDFKQLIGICPDLSKFVCRNKYMDESIDYFNPAAVKMLNKALLKQFYGIDYWDIPPNYLCPPIPGRAEYIHHVADLLSKTRDLIDHNKIPGSNKIKCLDIGIGASCVYPIIGNKEYGWSFIGSDIDPKSIESAKKIIESNPSLSGQIECRLQHDPKYIFHGIIKKDEQFDLSICNPPFHASPEEARSAAIRKLKNLKNKKIKNPIRNFEGQSNELWCEGGEEKFVTDMIYQSKQYQTSFLWFSTLISKDSILKKINKVLKMAAVSARKIIPMTHGNKKSRIVAWTFLSHDLQKKWIKTRWGDS